MGCKSLLARMFLRKTTRRWNTRIDNAQSEVKAAKTSADAKQKAVQSYEAELNSVIQRAIGLRKTKTQVETRLETARRNRQKLVNGGVRLIDQDFFELPADEFHQSAPWFHADDHKLREELFERAMDVHKAFIDVAAKEVRANLSVFMSDFGTKSLGNREFDVYISDLWATFFLLVPMISTTFASLGRLFSKIDASAIGWLVVDEAGQTSPQHAVVGLEKARRAIVVGDPLQVPPIITLPESITRKFCDIFGVDHDRYIAHKASAQTLADSASQYFYAFQSEEGKREAGIPLLVHRRCDEPMFSISNNIAYGGEMVFAKGEHRSEFDSTLGPSGWIDVKGNSTNKWVRDEGEAVLDLLAELKSASLPPDLYIVAPFRNVQHELRKLIKGRTQIREWVSAHQSMGESFAFNSWVDERVGTVHTVQGREAAVVIFVLGASGAEELGARNWAASTPNILNVAVTRAKQNLYVVGDRNAWGSIGYFGELSSNLPH